MFLYDFVYEGEWVLLVLTVSTVSTSHFGIKVKLYHRNFYYQSELELSLSWRVNCISNKCDISSGDIIVTINVTGTWRLCTPVEFHL